MPLFHYPTTPPPLSVFPMLVEEIPKTISTNPSIIYFLSLVKLQALPALRNDTEELRSEKNRPKVNYNITDLLNAQQQVNYNGSGNGGVFKSSHQMQLEKLITKRLLELSRESPNPAFELPKMFAYISTHKWLNAADKKIRNGNSLAAKRILAARRNFNSYLDEEKNWIWTNTIQGVHFLFAEQKWELQATKRKVLLVLKPKVRLCCVCGSQSPYSRCGACGLYSCSVKCRRLHFESRCV